jgi:hypothetical protein
LQRGEARERQAVAGEQVELGDRQRHQPLERAAAALPEHGDRGHEEHEDQREQADQRRADAVERLDALVEHEPQEGDQRDGTTNTIASVRRSRRSWAATRPAVARTTRPLMMRSPAR